MQSDNNQRIIRKISEKLQHSLYHWYGANAVLNSQQPFVERMRYSFILHYQVNLKSNNNPSLIVKINSSPDFVNIERAISSTGGSTNAEKEYFLMKSIENTIKNTGKPTLDAIRMLDFLPEWNAIVMEKFPGKILREHFIERILFFGQEENRKFIEKTLYHSGDWLRIFHNQIGKKERLPFLVDDWLEDVNISFDYLRPRINRVAEIDSIHQKFVQISDKLINCSVQYATLHGDFHMKNVFVKEDGSIACFDPHPSKRGSIYRDLARMAIDPMTIKFQVLSRGLLIRRKFSTKCLSSVLKGYFQEDSLNPIFFTLFTASEYLRKWRDDEYQLRKLTRNNPLLRQILSSYISTYFVRSIRRELAQLDKMVWRSSSNFFSTKGLLENYDNIN